MVSTVKNNMDRNICEPTRSSDLDSMYKCDIHIYFLHSDEGKEIALKQAKCSNHAEIMCLLFDKFPPSSDIQFVKCLERSSE